MKKKLQFVLAKAESEDQKDLKFVKASNPGNCQLDIRVSEKLPVYYYGDNIKKYEYLESKFFIYKTAFKKDAAFTGKCVLLKCAGVDYRYKILVNGKPVYAYEGLVKPVNLDITKLIKPDNEIIVVIYPMAANPNDDFKRYDFKQNCKPAVSYSWDFAPRMPSVGIVNEMYLEIVPENYIKDFQITYELSADLKEAQIHVAGETSRGGSLSLELTCGKEKHKFTSADANFSVKLKNPKLWWPNELGKQDLYKAVLKLENGSQAEKTIGLRRVELVSKNAKNIFANVPSSQSKPPFCLKINNKIVFAKGANWTMPDVFYGTITAKTYNKLLSLCDKAHMNLIRCWGGAPLNKEEFFELCDKKGLMVWQEFPLACNDYKSTPEYLEVLKSEAENILLKTRSHASVVMYCGGNELISEFAGMSPQSIALRMLDSLCLQYAKNIPFIKTSPIMGAVHGGYSYTYDAWGKENHGKGPECFKVFEKSGATAYNEFGIGTISSRETLLKIMDEKQLFEIKAGTPWESHHGINCANHISDSWSQIPKIERFFKKAENIDQLIFNSQFLQTVGMKAIYEEARLQRGTNSFALVWCLNDVWPAAANSSIIEHGGKPKAAYYGVAESLKNTVFVLKFDSVNVIPYSLLRLCLTSDVKYKKNITVSVYKQQNGKKEKIFESAVKADLDHSDMFISDFYIGDIQDGIVDILVECTDKNLNNNYKFIAHSKTV